MSLYTKYLEEIESRKETGLHPKPIDEGALVEELIAHILDPASEHRTQALDFVVYNTLPGTTSAAEVNLRDVLGGMCRHFLSDLSALF